MEFAEFIVDFGKEGEQSPSVFFDVYELAARFDEGTKDGGFAQAGDSDWDCMQKSSACVEWPLFDPFASRGSKLGSGTVPEGLFDDGVVVELDASTVQKWLDEVAEPGVLVAPLEPTPPIAWLLTRESAVAPTLKVEICR